MGSFLNCCAYRLCHGLSIVKGRSRCDSCEHILGVRDLVPVFSYIFSKGRCRYCGTKLSPRYPISELVSGIAFLLVVANYGLTAETAQILILTSLMLCISFADLEDSIIPDVLIVLGIINRLVFILFSGSILQNLKQSCINALCIGAPLYLLVFIMEKILKKEAMGGGDIKLVFMLGLYAGISQSLLAVLTACFAGLAFAFLSKKTKTEFPFGPSLCLGYFISILYGGSIISAYLSLF